MQMKILGAGALLMVGWLWFYLPETSALTVTVKKQPGHGCPGCLRLCITSGMAFAGSECRIWKINCTRSYNRPWPYLEH